MDEIDRIIQANQDTRDKMDLPMVSETAEDFADAVAMEYSDSQEVKERHWIEFCEALIFLKSCCDELSVKRDSWPENEDAIIWHLFDSSEVPVAGHPDLDMGRDYDSLFKRLGLKP